MLVYFTQHWLPKHAGSATTSGVLIAVPSSLSAIKSHLATEFETLGRLGDWDAATGTGDPMHSMQIRDVLKGYAKHATAQGCSKRGVAPLTEAEMHMLLSSIHQQASNTTDQAQLLLLLRDGLLFSLLWQTCFRGSKAGATRLDNILLPTGGSAVAHLVPSRQLGAGAMLHLLPDQTKNNKEGHCSVTLSCDLLCFSTWLMLAVYHYASPSPTS